ncbi:hypothetical protein B0T25DRAFT_546599 [Lasiosphaeria hispida]|uniref:Uncharacterized protein n=1 Tax=Lasiosphaeria hispida TaxID=260671 RepID=A0AAJ0HDI2_9PEZI|nr:hypothetical protein B0T25DRAFT_546599 [Lasiosphaeria hispida]
MLLSRRSFALRAITQAAIWLCVPVRPEIYSEREVGDVSDAGCAHGHCASLVLLPFSSEARADAALAPARLWLACLVIGVTTDLSDRLCIYVCTLLKTARRCSPPHPLS